MCVHITLIYASSSFTAPFFWILCQQVCDKDWNSTLLGVGVGMGYASMSWEFLVWKVMGLERKGAALFWTTDRSESGMV